MAAVFPSLGEIPSGKHIDRHWPSLDILGWFKDQDFRKVIHIIEYNVSDAAAQAGTVVPWGRRLAWPGQQDKLRHAEWNGVVDEWIEMTWRPSKTTDLGVAFWAQRRKYDDYSIIEHPIEVVTTAQPHASIMNLVFGVLGAAC